MVVNGDILLTTNPHVIPNLRPSLIFRTQIKIFLWNRRIQQSLTIHLFSSSLCSSSSSPIFPAQALAAVKFDDEPFWVSSRKRKDGKKKTLNTKNICFASTKHCISFDYLHYTMQRNISKGWIFAEGCSRARLSASTSSQFTFGVRNPRPKLRNWLSSSAFDLVSEDGSHITKATKLARKWTMFTDSYLLSVTLLTGVHTTNAGYSCSGRILQTQACLWLERAWWRSRCDQRKIAMLEEVEKKNRPRTTGKLLKLSLICNSSERKIRNRWHDNYQCSEHKPHSTRGFKNGTQ